MANGRIGYLFQEEESYGVSEGADVGEVESGRGTADAGRLWAGFDTEEVIWTA